MGKDPADFLPFNLTLLDQTRHRRISDPIYRRKDLAPSTEMGRSEHLKYLPMIIQGTAGTGLSVCKPNEIIKANLLTQHLIGNQFSLPTVQGKKKSRRE